MIALHAGNMGVKQGLENVVEAARQADATRSPVRFVLLGGVEIGDATLLRWYVLHVLMLPFVIVIFMAIHFWRVRKDGGISGPL